MSDCILIKSRIVYSSFDYNLQSEQVSIIIRNTGTLRNPDAVLQTVYILNKEKHPQHADVSPGICQYCVRWPE